MKRIIIFVIISLLNPNFIYAKYSGGEGTKNNPWRISSKTDLLSMGENTEDYNDCFVMTNDINLAGDVFTTALIAADTSSSGGFQGTKFTGVFDGNDLKIENFTIGCNSNNICLGLFGYVQAGEIKNLGLENIFINGNGYGVSGLLVGKNENGKIINCYSNGNVAGIMDEVGGLIGTNYKGIVSKCHSAGSINVGGTVNGNGCITGGLVGDSYNGSISNCYSSVSVKSDYRVGGLVGCNNGNISNCYSTGFVSGLSIFGGLAGVNPWGSISNCFWNTETSGQVISAGGIGLTTVQMQQKSIYTTAPSNWDFINTWAIGENQTYPYLRQTPASDINQDKKVDYLDLAALAENWLTGIE